MFLFDILYTYTAPPQVVEVMTTAPSQVVEVMTTAPPQVVTIYEVLTKTPSFKCNGKQCIDSIFYTIVKCIFTI